MKLVILHKNVKREINGPLSICCNRTYLEKLKSIIEKELESGHAFGWIDIDEVVYDADNNFNITKKQKPLINTEPIDWEE